MDEVLTKAQIFERYPSEWVLIEDPETSEDLEVLSGRVLFHSRDREEVYRRGIESRPPRIAVLYTGTVPDNVAILI